MSIHIYISVFLLTITILSTVNSQNAIQEYVIRKDFFRFYKAPEYTVYDTKEKHIYYRIESSFNILQNIKLIAYPSKQEIGRLQAKIKPFLYKGEFSFVDPQSNRKVNGLIQQIFKLTSDLFTIEWDENRLTMTKESVSLSSIFRDSDGEILAEFRLRPASMLWTNKYDMKIFSDKYPESIYLLALAVKDTMQSGRK